VTPGFFYIFLEDNLNPPHMMAALKSIEKDTGLSPPHRNETIYGTGIRVKDSP